MGASVDRDGRINGIICVYISPPRNTRASAFLLLRGGHHFQNSGSLVNGSPGSA